jgi:hypothetical protein
VNKLDALVEVGKQRNRLHTFQVVVVAVDTKPDQRHMTGDADTNLHSMVLGMEVGIPSDLLGNVENND